MKRIKNRVTPPKPLKSANLLYCKFTRGQRARAETKIRPLCVSFCICLLYHGKKARARAGRKFRYAISLPTAIIITVDSSWRMRSARARLWRNHNGTSSTPRAELRVKHERGSSVSDNTLFEYISGANRLYEVAEMR